MFEKILIANRGEIACRIIRECKRLGILSVAVFPEPDRDSLHSKLADESLSLGPDPYAYMDMDVIIKAATESESDAIHPGYGFLSENPSFRRACDEEGIAFIGPSERNMREMRDKVKAREFMKRYLPVVPGTQVLEDFNDAKRKAIEIGYPIILKAVSGGGGRGLRIVNSKEELRKFSSASREAEKTFKDKRIYIEKYFENVRHIEFQVLEDGENFFCLGERECSIQRRHQKLLEEAPSFLREKVRKEISKKILKALKALKYESAGTLEFLIDENGYCFIEMNTRIQVEHPVTEMVCSLNLVEQQIRIASLKPLNLDFNISGHSIECRINAENPKTFVPSLGRIVEYREPKVRVDTGVYEGYEITPYYDTLLSKVVVLGKDREKAISKMKKALKSYVISGIETNIPLHLKILNDYHFLTGKIDTSFLKRISLEDKKVLKIQSSENLWKLSERL
ncbi:MAG: acetyl/propionyl/methylcrotonyl-CoA carboxylase subunit alpha [Candidatus Methanofastidiosia archaeon]